MKAIIRHFTLLLFFSASIHAQSPVGVWKTIDDITGEAKSYIQISEDNGKLSGKIVKLLQVAEDTTCDECPGTKKDKPLMGMEILWNLKKDGDQWSGGKIMDPENGKTYKCKIWFEGNDGEELHLRGYIGVSLLGRNQVWKRVSE